MRLSILPLAALALAACSQSDDTPAAEETAAPARATPSATPVAANTVPEAFRGVWDFVDGTCNPASDLRVAIEERAFEFYESHGEVTGVTVESPTSIVVDLAMEGEGETWTMRRRFTLSNGGARLMPAAVDGEDFEPMPLKRCQS